MPNILLLSTATMITEAISTITSWVDGFVTLLVSMFTSMTGVFWDPTLNTGTGGLTIIGGLALMGLAIGLVRLGFNFVRSLFQR